MKTDPMRVLMLFTVLDRGGAETMVMNYLRRMEREKVIFDFIVHRERRGAYDDEVERLGGRIFRLPPLRFSRLGEYRRAVRDFFDTHPGYRAVHGHCSELGYFIYKEARRRGLPFIAAHAHNTPRGWDLKTPLRWALKRLMRPHLTFLFTCSGSSARWLFGRRLARRAVLLPNAVDAASFAFDPSMREQVRSREGWSERPVIGHVGRFSRQKNHLFLLRVFTLVLRVEPRALLVLVGSGGELEGRVRRRAERLGIASSVVFAGSRSDIPALMQGFDLFLFPSRFEGLSVAMVEAQAAGLPIVTSTKIPRQGTIIPSLVTALSPGGPRRWATEVIRILRERAHRKDRRAVHAEIAAAGMDITTNVQWLQNLYLEHAR